MKRIIIISSFAATALFTLTGGVQAQNSIEQVLKNIETNNKELQANAQLITSQKLESKTDNNLPDPTLSYAHLWGAKDKNETIGELVVSQSFDFPSLYATRNKLNRLKAGAYDSQADVFRRDEQNQSGITERPHRSLTQRNGAPQQNAGTEYAERQYPGGL